MIIYSIKLQGNDYKLINPIIIEEEDILMSGKRMIKIYNNDLHILGYCTNIEMGREIMKKSLNLLIHSVLFEPDWIFTKPMPSLKRRCSRFQEHIRRHVYG